MSKFKTLLFVLLSLFAIGFISSCEKNDNDKPNTNDKGEVVEESQQEKIYKLALSSGYTGTYEEWLASIKGDKIELKVESNYIKWKYTKESNWTNLVSLSEFAGKDGATGKDGSNGKEIELSTNATHIIYRYVGDTEWTNLLPIDDIQGQSAYEIAVELGFVGTVEDWILSLRGDNGLSAYEIYKKYYPEYTGSEEDWINELANGTLLAKDNKATVTFKDGDTVLKTEQYYYGQAINEFEPTKESHEFVGWSYKEYPWNFDLFTIGKDIVLQANWNKIHTISFNTGTTQVIANETAKDGCYITLPTVNYRNGYAFLGWKYDGAYYDCGESFVLTDDMDLNIELIADWAKVSASTLNLYGKAPEDIAYTDLDNDRLDVYVNYNGVQGITWRGNNFTNPVENILYQKGDLLPTWRAFAENTKTNIYDASNYNCTTNDAIWTSVTSNNMMSETDSTQAIDLLYTTNINLTSGKFIDLLADDGTGNQYIDYMPNFKKWWDANEAVQSQLLYNGKLYYTPYAEGYNEIERTFNMDTDLVRKVLDVTSFDAFDTTTTNGGSLASTNVLQGGKYTPFIDANYNYPDKSTVVKVLIGNTAQEISIKQTTNIIKQQNELLAVGCTGKQLAEQFAAYIDAAFGHLIGNNVDSVYKNRSEIFISEKAAYNADELIALMRVIKANPGLITGDASKEIETLFPRGQAANRIESIMHFAQIWGVHGLTSSNDRNYFSPDGKLASSKSTKASYDALKYLSALYDEGLILDKFYYSDGIKRDTAYLDKYYKKNVENYGYGFITFDFAATISYSNDNINGLGVNPSSRKISNFTENGIRTVIPPLSYWATDSTWSVNQDLFDKTGKSLLRFVENNKGFKSTSWGIPTTSDNVYAALRLMDYLYSEKGNMINCFGPEQYWYKPTSDDLLAGDAYLADGSSLNDSLVSYSLLGLNTKSPILSNQTKELLATESNFWTFMRGYLGATHSIGHLRHKGLNIQALNEYAQSGLSGLYAACEAGVVVQAKNCKYADYTWDTTVPKGGYHKDTTNAYAGITEFWKQANCWSATPQGWVKVVVSGYDTDLSGTVVSKSGVVEYTYKDVQDQFDAFNKGFLYTYANELGNNGKYIPNYAKATN